MFCFNVEIAEFVDLLSLLLQRTLPANFARDDDFFDYDEGMSNQLENTDEDRQLRLNLVQRIVVAQAILVVITGLLILICLYTGLGWFWFAFISGVFGSSVALVRRTTSGGKVTYFSKDSWLLVLSPLMFGGIMAGVVYILMGSGLISGAEGDGLLKTNLFPSFGPKELLNELAEMTNFLKIRPSTLQDAAKLIVWCFVAGYSENFVTGILSNFDKRATSMIAGSSNSDVE